MLNFIKNDFMTATEIAKVIETIIKIDGEMIIEIVSSDMIGEYQTCFYHYIESHNGNRLSKDSILEEIRKLLPNKVPQNGATEGNTFIVVGKPSN